MEASEANAAEMPSHQCRSATDCLLTFQADYAGGWPCRDTGEVWQPVSKGESWQLWQTAQHERWTGPPILQLQMQGWQIWLLGELYGQACAEVFLSDWFAGPRDGRDLNGHFVLMAWHEPARQWHVWTDRFGTLHAYHAHDGQRAAIGTFSPAVAAAASRHSLDWKGLTSFFTFGFFAEDRTFFDDVRVLRPASYYVFDESGRFCHQKRYWEWDYRPDPQRDYDETVDTFAELWQQVMIDHLRGGRVALPISGGLDSRSTVATLATISPARPIWPYTYGYGADSVETRIAQQVAQAAGLPLQAFVITPYLFDDLERVLSSVEGFQDVTQCRQASAVDEIGRHADYLLAAHWGDVWLDDMGLVGDAGELDDEAVLSHALHKLEKRGRAWLLQHLCRPQLNGDDPERLARQIVTREMAAVQHISEPDFRVKAFKTEQWSWRWTLASLRMFQPAAWPRLPFYDTRLADFFCTVPSAFVAGRQLQIDYLKRYAPELARVKWQVYDTNLFRYQYFNSLLLPKRALKKAWRLITRKQIVEANWEVQFLNDAGRGGLQRWLLEPGLRLHDFVTPAALTELLTDFYGDPWREKRGYTISMLLTFSAWLEHYGGE